MPNYPSDDRFQTYVTGFTTRFQRPTGIMDVRVSLVALQKGGDAGSITSTLVTCVLGIERYITSAWSLDDNPRPDYKKTLIVDRNAIITVRVQARLEVTNQRELPTRALAFSKAKVHPHPAAGGVN